MLESPGRRRRKVGETLGGSTAALALAFLLRRAVRAGVADGVGCLEALVVAVEGDPAHPGAVFPQKSQRSPSPASPRAASAFPSASTSVRGSPIARDSTPSPAPSLPCRPQPVGAREDRPRSAPPRAGVRHSQSQRLRHRRAAPAHRRPPRAGPGVAPRAPERGAPLCEWRREACASRWQARAAALPRAGADGAHASTTPGWCAWRPSIPRGPTRRNPPPWHATRWPVDFASWT